jgi:dephospho-CoA kinase
MLKVGITGGIGSGKTTVCSFFEVLGIPVFYADEAARAIMDEDPDLVAAISALFGKHLYASGKLDRALLSKVVFEEPDKLKALNALVHPASIAAGNRWLEGQTTPYAIKEAAIFFESGSYTSMDIMIGVYAPVDIRIDRAVNRGGLTESEVRSRMARQMDEDLKMKRCDYVIINDDITPVIPQVLRLHEELLKRSVKA